eukprot:TRINITY_DN1667_c3_g3_i1.p1 TRINITY_DN1667_c3_g3~~TRINITY_DN1667_c3_g3_i1.p1  ORF type:complete len:534 (+),score=81.62 TRINITY_DN1667_c3_g3_i1:87-1688(+)
MTAYMRNIADKVMHPPAMLKEQEFQLGTIEKFTHYGRVPCKMILNLVVSILLLIRVCVYTPGENKYVAHSVERLGTSFSPMWEAPSNTRVNIYSFEDFREFASDSYQSFTELPNDDTGTWLITKNQTMTVRYLTPPHTYREVLLQPSLDLPATEITCDIANENPLGPFRPTSPDRNSTACDGIPDIKWKINSAEVSFTARSIRQVGHLLTPICYQWHVTQYYDFKKAGLIRFNVDIFGSLCGLEGVDNGFGASMDYLCMFMLLVGVWGMVLRIKSVRRVRKLRLILENKINTSGRSSAYALQGMSPEDTEDLTTVSSVETNTSRIEFLHEALDQVTTNTQNRKGYSWLVAGIFGDVFVIISCFLDLYVYHTNTDVPGDTLQASNVMLGLAAFVQWSIFVAHLGDQPWLFLLISSLRKGTPLALRFITGCMPIYLGYALLGTHVFGYYCKRFISIDISCVSLFAMLNGDVVHETFSDVFPDQNFFTQFFSRMYLYSFIILFIYVILNIFLAIMEDTYFQIKQALVIDLQDDFKK